MANLSTAGKCTDLQKYILQLPKSQAILKGNVQEEEKKETEESNTTCTIEILAIEANKKETEGSSTKVGYSIDFTYKEKSKRKMDVSQKWLEHYKSMRTLLNKWDNLTLTEI